MSEEKKSVAVPAKFQAIVAEIEKMSVLELSELVKAIEEKRDMTSVLGIAFMKDGRFYRANPPMAAQDLDSIDMQEFRNKLIALFIQNSVADQKYYSTLTSIFFEQFFYRIGIRR